MKSISSAVRKETKYIAVCVVILSIIMQVVFLVLRRWDYRVLLGNVLSGAVAVLNFLLMGITVQKALEKDEKSAKAQMRASQSFRTLLQFIAAAVGAAAPIFNTATAIIPLFFPRIAIAFRPRFKDKEADN